LAKQQGGFAGNRVSIGTRSALNRVSMEEKSSFDRHSMQEESSFGRHTVGQLSAGNGRLQRGRICNVGLRPTSLFFIRTCGAQEDSCPAGFSCYRTRKFATDPKTSAGEALLQLLDADRHVD
jgi:hypothetical protein